GSRINTAVSFLGDLVSPLSPPDLNAGRIPPSANGWLLRLHALACGAGPAENAGIQPSTHSDCRRVRAGTRGTAACGLVQRAFPAEMAHRGARTRSRRGTVAIRIGPEQPVAVRDRLCGRGWTELVFGGLPCLPGRALSHGGAGHRYRLHLRLE